MTTAEYTVTGMTCSHCELSVTEEVSKIPGVTDVKADASSGRLAVTSNEAIETNAVIAAVEEAGYEIASASPGER